MNTVELMEALQGLYLKKDGSLDEFNFEAHAIREALDKISAKLRGTHEFVSVEGRGGSGIVFKVRDEQARTLRALKVPRPRKDELIESVQNEIDHLTSLAHDNLIPVFAAGEVDIRSLKVPYPYFVMEYVENREDLLEALERKLEETRATSDIPRLTNWLASKARQVADAISFLHSHKTLHFDIKPANVLVDASEKAILSDLGFAKRVTDETAPTVVGFTLFYAHPTLRTAYEHMSSQNRVRRPLPPAQFAYAWDIYAFGRSLLQLLARVEARFPYAVMYDYTFVYLHLMACRMLDGRNLAKDETNRIKEEQLNRGAVPSIYVENWLTLKAEDFAGLKYSEMGQVCADFEKLVNRDYYIRAIPELSAHYPHRVQVATTGPPPFSRRIKVLVEHPVFLRLRSVKQLGVSDTIYPGCTHTRAEHSLGAFRMCWLYLLPLLYDPYNPIFRQLTDPKDLKALLIASLLHDLGQYPLAHDMEEAAPHALKDLFSHERITLKWLDNPTPDPEGRTIRQIIENEGAGWGVRLNDLKDVLATDDETRLRLSVPGLKMRLLRSILDGPIDVDKLDYLVRDSRRADIPYGLFIDSDRLVRNLTVVLTKDKDDSDGTLLTLGTYEKGLSAAESVTFARYELYQALYWHHAVRAIRPMLREVLRSGYFEKPKPKTKGRFEEQFDRFLGLGAQPREVGVDDLLKFLAKFSNDHGNELLGLIRSRRFYKRILTVHSHHEEEGKPSLLQRFRDARKRPEFDGDLQREIAQRLDNYLAAAAGPRQSTLAKERIDPIIGELKKQGRILSDCPSPRSGSKEKLRFALEPKRRLQNYSSRVEAGERVSEVWQQVFYKLMEIASKGRVYCHPDIRDGLMAALGPEGIRDALEMVVTKFEK